MDNVSVQEVNSHGSKPSMPLDTDNKPRIKKLDRKRRRQEVGKTLSAFLIRMSDQIQGTDLDKRLRLFRTMIKGHKYLDNDFYGYVDQNMSWVEASKQSEDEIWYTDNQLYPYLRTAMMEMSRGQTDVLVNASTPDNTEMEAAAKFAKTRYDAIRAKTFKPRLKQTENSYALINGITFRYTFPQFSAPNSRSEQVPVMQQGNPEKQTMKLCANCFRPDVDVEADVQDILGAEYIESEKKCVGCGSTVFNDHEIDMGPDVVIGYEEIPLCENAWIVPNPVGIIVSLQADCIQATKYLKWNLLVMRSVLEHKYPGIELPSTGTMSPELRYVANQQVSSPDVPTSGMESSLSSGEQELELLEYQQHWLDYELYCDVTFEDDMPVSGGKTLKAGKSLGSIYPDGLYFVRVGDVILDMHSEDKNRKWTSSPYGIRAGSMYGSGSAVAYSDQELINDLKRLIMANAWSNGVPREFVDQSLIPELSADPTVVTRVQGDGTGKNIVGVAYAQAPATTLSAEIYKLEDNAKGSMQNKIGAMSGAGAGGLADAQKWGDTATAISIKRDLAVGRFSPDLELMADQLDCEQAKQFLKNEQQFFTPQQWKATVGDHDQEGLEAFIECDIDRDLSFSIAPGSHMPKSDAQMQSKIIGLAQILPALAQTNSVELINLAFETFNIPKSVGGWNSDRAQAQRVVERFSVLAAQFVEVYGDVPTNDLEDPAVQQAVMSIEKYAQMPVDVFLDNHEALSDAYRDIRTTDTGRSWSNLMIAAVAGRVMQHKVAVGKQEAMMARIAQAAQQPLIDAQNAQKADAQADQEAAAAEEAQLAIADKTVEYNDRDQQREHDLKMQGAEHEQQARLKLAELAATQNEPGTTATE